MKLRKLFQNKFVVLSMVALLIVSLVLPFPNFKHKVKVDAARERILSEVTDPNLLDKYNHLDITKWTPYYYSPKSLWEPRTLGQYGDISDDNGSRFGSFSTANTKNEFKLYVNGTAAFGRNLGVAQSIDTIAGHRYQISYTASYTGPTADHPVGRSSTNVLNSVDLNTGTSMLSPDFSALTSDQNVFKSATFTGTGEKVTAFVYVVPYPTFTNSKFTGMSIIDLDQGVEEARVGIDDLFRDETHTKLKLSVIQDDIDKVQGQIDIILDPAIKQEFQTELNKAQKLMDDANPSFTIEQLVDNPNDEHSSTIIGKTQPEVMLRFSGSLALPDPDLASDNPRNTLLYSVRADENGNFRFKLPAGNYFKAGEQIMVLSTIYGKSVLFYEDVIDTTPPDQPVFQNPLDKDTNFVGTGEANSTIEIFDSSKTKIAEGTADAEGKFAVPIPSTLMPLIPYTKYYAVSVDASGNRSVDSAAAEVVDTTPPSATGIKQEFHVGDTLPTDPRLMLANVADNAGTGSDNLTFSYEKVPDLTHYGFQKASVKIQDKAGNSVLVEVPVFVLDKDMEGNGTAYIRAKDFVMYSTDFPLSKEEIANWVKQESQAEIWEGNGDNLGASVPLDQATVSDNISETPGTYFAEIAWSGFTKRIQVTVKSDALTFDEVPTELAYSGTIKSYRQLLQPTTNAQLKIDDGRRTVHNWQLKAAVSSPLTSANGKELSGNLVYRTKDENGKINEQPLSQVSAPIFINQQAEQGITSIGLKQENDCGLVLDALPGEIYADMDYKAGITWTLEDAP
ncbi:Ig-like domain-containing protein [Listeria kieliensis]